VAGQLGFFHKIHTRFILSFVCVVVGLTTIITTMIYKDYNAIIDSTAQVSMSRLSESIFQTLYVSMNSGGSEYVHEALREAKSKKLVDQLELFTSQAIFDLFGRDEVYNPPSDIRVVFDTAIERYETTNSESGRALRYIKPFPAKPECVECHTNVAIGDVLGVMDLSLSLTQFDALAHESIQGIITLIIVLVVSSGILLNIVSSKLIFAPLAELQTTTRKLASNAGEPNVQLGEWGKNEFGEVAHNFNNFISKVYAINSRLANEEQKIKELLAGREEEIVRRTKEVHDLNREMIRYMETVDEYVLTSRTDTRGIITDASTAFCRISGYVKDEMIGQPHNIVRHPDTPKEIFTEMWQTIKEGKTWYGEMKNRTKSGDFYWVKMVVSPLFDRSSTITGYVAVRYDISTQKELEKTLQKLVEATKRSHTDSLTGMINRLRINELLQMEIDRVERYGGDLCVALMDIDKFKNINDTYGHLVGDRVLIMMAKILTQKTRKTDLAGRWGGEEFLIVLTNTPLDGAVKKLETVRHLIETEDFESIPKVTASFGVASYQSQDTLESLVGRADVALYFAKENGRNRVEAAPTVPKKNLEFDLEKGDADDRPETA
jgi:diguanylate cyclase (GGDEF)-like protein/PAS domain S-box-containing protein